MAEVIGQCWAERVCGGEHRAREAWPEREERALAIARRKVAQLGRDPWLVDELAAVCSRGAAAWCRDPRQRRSDRGDRGSAAELDQGRADPPRAGERRQLRGQPARPAAAAARDARQQGRRVDARPGDRRRAREVARKEGGLVEGQVASWETVGVITGAKREGRSGEAETTYRFWLLEPGGVQRPDRARSVQDRGALHGAGEEEWEGRERGVACAGAAGGVG